MTLTSANNSILEVATSSNFEELQNLLIYGINSGELEGTGLLEFLFEKSTYAFYLTLKALA